MTATMRRGARSVDESRGGLRTCGVRRVEAWSSPFGGVGTTARPSAPDQLRALASRVRHVGLNGRFDPEAAFIERDELAHALRRLADRLEREKGQPSSAAPASASRAVLPRRLAAAFAARTSEIASLRALLAQAMRPRERRRRAVSEAQLMLPLTEALDDR